MKVNFNNKTRTKIPRALLLRAVQDFTRQYRVQSDELSVAFVGDQTMRRLNHTYRGYDRPTDILSFEGDDELFGELIIDIAQIKRQKPIYSSRFNAELLFIFVHGLLHLQGYSDETEKGLKKMMRLGGQFISKNDLI